ncbi:MAG: WXG100 family type VII secretion target [Nocardiaceae bacterium]|nr:WXG100 family type VII secretion target [Nocardiaceae bacterium]
MSSIHYDYAGIESLLAQAQSEQQQLASLVEDMNGVKNQTQALWQDPSSAEAFQAAYSKWVSGAQEVQQVLASIINAAQTGSGDMQSTNNSIAGSWGG